jgi:Secretion system C-terminal sorting domain
MLIRKIAYLVIILIAPLSIHAQTITLGQIRPLSYCSGYTLMVTYTASGSFNYDNDFIAQLSDSNASFSTFTDVDNREALGGTFYITLPSPGKYLMRVVSTDPIVVSTITADTIIVHAKPSPGPITRNYNISGFGGYIAGGFVGDTILLKDNSEELVGSTYSWTFNEDASPDTSTANFATVTYPSDGIKDGTLTVTSMDQDGCSTSGHFSFQVLSCDPIIPSNAHIVTATETGSDTVVWVKAGGIYTADAYDYAQTVFAESGAIVIARGEFATFYLKPGSSFTFSAPGFNTVLLNTGDTISFPNGYCDTLSCSDLNFDYSQIQADVTDNPPPSNITILQSGDHLFANDEGLPIEICVSNILGSEVLSQSGNSALDIDLSPLPAGVYFAVVQAGNERQVQKIAVVH